MIINTPDWVRQSVFYQIFPDRFARSGRVRIAAELEPWNSAPTVYGFKGGDLYGVAERLDYLADLGINAIYFCPIFSSAANHRYHTYDYFNVDPLLGGNEALRELLDQAHARRIRIVLDGVFNHASRGFWQFHHVLENGGASPYRDWFHFDPERLNGHKPFQPYPTGEAAHALSMGRGSLESIGYSAWWNLPALPKFNTDCPEVREFLLSVAEYWVRFGIDGWRLDVPNEIDDDDFWRDFRRRVRAINPETYLVGEVWGEARRWLQGDMWDAVMNYQITAACLGYFGGDSLDLEETRRPSSFGNVRHFSAAEFIAEVRRVSSMYAAEVSASQLNLLDSHDMPRFLTCCRGNRDALMLAWLFICLIPGAPCVYYGDEVGLDGRHDPDCRKGFPWSEDLQDRELFSWYQQCIRLRQRHPTVTSQQPVLSVIADTAVVVRHSGLVAVLNPSNSAVEVDLSIPDGESMLDWQTKQPMLCRPWQLKARTAAVFEAADQTLRGVVK